MVRRSKQQTTSTTQQTRGKLLLWLMYLGFLAVIARLAYWQIFRGSSLQAVAEDQHTTLIRQTSKRGRILSSDGYTLVDNQKVYRLFAEPNVFNRSEAEIANQLLPILLEANQAFREATEAAFRASLSEELEATLSARLAKEAKWVALSSKIDEETKTNIENLELAGIGFDPYYVRAYPEASIAAHVTGFVGKDRLGEDQGYFGIEGALDKELAGRTLEQLRQRDARGFLFWLDQSWSGGDLRGRDVILTLRRDVQHLVETTLQAGIEQYGAKAGEIVVMDPKTGHILAMASFPSYDQQSFFEFDPALYKNPSVINTYEPGSTLKTLTVAAGIDSGAINPDTKCDICQGPAEIGKYTIRTWNNEYNPDTDMTTALAKSDNIAMIFIARKLGHQQFYDYLERFGIGQPIMIDLQEDTATPFERKEGDIHLATNSFGQGIVTTSMQLVRAVASIANQGTMMRPQVIEKVLDPVTQREISTEPIVEKQVISPQSAQTVTQMMIAAAEAGEAQWTRSRTHTIAGKTGTSQVADETGGYDESKTITSFIGFAPATDPQFVMLVKLVEPTSSPWAAETAAPLWYQVANRLFLLLNIPPDKL